MSESIFLPIDLRVDTYALAVTGKGKSTPAQEGDGAQLEGILDAMTGPRGSVTLRLLRESDWQAVHSWARDPRVCRYQAWGPNTEEQTRGFVRDAVTAMQDRPQTRWVMAVVLEGAVVGNCELNLRDSGEGEIAYAVHPDHWGKGLATTSAAQLVGFAFEELGLHRVFATCDPRNTASSRVMQRLGMRFEGRKLRTVLIRDGWRDSDYYGLLVAEWRPPPQGHPDHR